MIVGQTQTLKLIDTLIATNKFPRTSLLIGERGCGKHLLSQYVADKLNIPLIDISNKISLATIEEISGCSEIRVYSISTSDLDERKQNIILKFLEEPMENAYIILLCENVNYLLNTIVNRCYAITCDKYTETELLQFLDKDNLSEEDIKFILSACTTPGQLKSISPTKLKELNSLTTKIVDYLYKANFSNTLTIANKLNYKDEYDKFDVNIFLSSMAKTITDKFNKTGDSKLYEMYLTTIEAQKILNLYNVNKQYTIEYYLSNI